MYSKGGHSLGIGYNECVYEDGRNWLQYVQKELSVGELQDDLKWRKEDIHWSKEISVLDNFDNYVLIGSKSEYKSAQ